MGYPLTGHNLQEYLESLLIPTECDDHKLISSIIQTPYTSINTDLPKFSKMCNDLYQSIESCQRMPYIFLLGKIYDETRNGIKEIRQRKEKLEVLKKILLEPNTPGDLLLIGQWMRHFPKLAFVDTTYAEWAALAKEFSKITKNSLHKQFWTKLDVPLVRDVDESEMRDEEIAKNTQNLNDVKIEVQLALKEAISDCKKAFVNILL